VKDFFIKILVQRGQRKYSRWYRLCMLLNTIIFICLLLPLIFIYTGKYIETYIHLRLPVWLTAFIVVLSLIVGIVLIFWTLVLQYGYAWGSGSHLAPPQKLIEVGPYKICRHPMQVGAIFFYLGLGTLFSSLTVGLYSALITLVVGYWFHKNIEEPVLVIRFGNQYKQYQKRVPLIPFLFVGLNDRDWKHKSNN